MIWRALSLAAIVGLAVLYFLPAWWVSLKAPNYPEHTFPVGIRIHFHVDGVRNGCEVRASREVTEKEALDCVHEMDTINHFVGMYPIASGGPVEKAFSPFLFAFLGVLLVGFVIPRASVRLIVMGAGFAAIAAWMTLAAHGSGGVAYVSHGYVHGLITSLGADDEKAADENLHPIVRQLKESLAKSGIGTDAPAAKVSKMASKAELINVLRDTYEHDQLRVPASEKKEWTGSLMQVFAWHYEKSLGRWFNQPEKNNRLVTIMQVVARIVFGAVLAAMLVFLFLARDDRSPLFWALVLAPMILPAAFLAEYSGWLWWYGHSLNEMGAFTLKPFMPTVFGQGKVAQFTTLSYPHIGFGLMMAVAILLFVAALVRRREMRGM
ncbi:MAG: hypothetical protein EPO23_08835 [Xanthobacteraceae bacterium]|nr:MAG: hypothetical protein EPO23_08835 [Xanthobacteraceae bacterium]